MGMFDYVRCKYPLPVPEVQERLFQPKDTDAQWMDRYEIREDGSLWHEAHDIEDRSDPAAPVGSFESIRGMMTPVNKRWEPCSEFTGELCFHDNWEWRNHNGDDDAYFKWYPGWIEFSAYFVKGQLRELHVITNNPAGPRDDPRKLPPALASQDGKK